MMLLKPLLSSLVLILLLSSCAQQEKVVTKTVFVEPQIPIKPAPPPLVLTDIRWYVVAKKNVKIFIKEIEKLNGDVAFVALSVRDYENLSNNLQEIRRYLLQQKAIRNYYEESLKTTKTPE